MGPGGLIIDWTVLTGLEFRSDRPIGLDWTNKANEFNRSRADQGGPDAMLLTMCVLSSVGDSDSENTVCESE